jgi:hypothetical protein
MLFLGRQRLERRSIAALAALVRVRSLAREFARFQ